MWSDLHGLVGEDRAETLLSLAEKAVDEPARARDALAMAESALAIWEEMGAVAPEIEKARAMDVIAIAHSRLGKFDEAIAAAERAVEIHRESGRYFLDEALRLLAALYLEQRRNEEALSALHESAQINEIDGEIFQYAKDLVGVAKVYGELERWQDLLSIAEKIIATGKICKSPHYVGMGYSYKALALAELGDPQEAILLATHALDLAQMSCGHETTMRAHYALAIARSRCGYYDEAIASLDSAEHYVHADLDYKFLAKIKQELVRIYRESDDAEQLEIEERRLNTLLDVIG